MIIEFIKEWVLLRKDHTPELIERIVDLEIENRRLRALHDLIQKAAESDIEVTVIPRNDPRDFAVVESVRLPPGANVGEALVTALRACLESSGTQG